MKLDLTGQRFGELLVIREHIEKHKSGSRLWVCKCDCGKQTIVTTGNLRNGSTKSCGCLKICGPKENLIGMKYNSLTVLKLHENKSKDGRYLWECVCDCGSNEVVLASARDLKQGRKKYCSCRSNTKSKPPVDLTGKKFNKLTVIKFLNKRNSSGEFMWLCRCDCGNIKKASTCDLTGGYVKSCGCLMGKNQFEDPKYLNKRYPRIYRIWQGMKKRCYYPNYERYKRYGGRGIKVCEEWQTPEPFIKWALKNGYREDLQLDRIDVDGDYTPSNCRWVTPKTNSRNKSNNVLITIEGKTKTITEWAEIAGVTVKTISDRIKRGWKGEEIILPAYKRRNEKG